jgi:hypothetical protein
VTDNHHAVGGPTTSVPFSWPTSRLRWCAGCQTKGRASVTAITVWSFFEKGHPKWVAKLGKRSRPMLQDAAHNPNNRIAIGTLIHVKHAVIGNECAEEPVWAAPQKNEPQPLKQPGFDAGNVEELFRHVGVFFTLCALGNSLMRPRAEPATKRQRTKAELAQAMERPPAFCSSPAITESSRSALARAAMSLAAAATWCLASTPTMRASSCLADNKARVKLFDGPRRREAASPIPSSVRARLVAGFTGA